MKNFLWLFLVLVAPVAAARGAAEPAYCKLENFLKLEVPSKGKGLNRPRAFKIGQLTLVGLAIGGSDATAVARLAESHGRFSSGDKYCTWYVNQGNKGAERSFHHHYLNLPLFRSKSDVAKEYSTTLRDRFDVDPVSFVSCAVNNNYLAVGCNGQMHRGPTVFAMILAYSGCTPARAVEIARTLWGRNFVDDSVREAAAQTAFDLGARHGESRAALQAVMQ